MMIKSQLVEGGGGWFLWEAERPRSADGALAAPRGPRGDLVRSGGCKDVPARLGVDQNCSSEIKPGLVKWLRRR